MGSPLPSGNLALLGLYVSINGVVERLYTPRGHWAHIPYVWARSPRLSLLAVYLRCRRRGFFDLALLACLVLRPRLVAHVSARGEAVRKHKGQRGDDGRICQARLPELDHTRATDDTFTHANGVVAFGDEQSTVGRRVEA